MATDTTITVRFAIPRQLTDAELLVLEVDPVARCATCRLSFDVRYQLGDSTERYAYSIDLGVGYDEHGRLIEHLPDGDPWPFGVLELLPATLEEAESLRVVGAATCGRLTVALGGSSASG